MRARRGFTLLEVLVATAIMAIAITGLLAAISTSVRNASRLTDRDRASMLARRKMEELIVQERLPRHTFLEGVYDARSGWKARVIPFELPPNPGPGQKVLDRIELQIWWVIAGRTMTFEMEGFRRSLLTKEEIDAGVLLPR